MTQYISPRTASAIFLLAILIGAGGTAFTLARANTAIPAEPASPELKPPEVVRVLDEHALNTDTFPIVTTYASTQHDPIGDQSLNAKIARMISVALQLRPRSPITSQNSGSYTEADMERGLTIARRNNENTREAISDSVRDVTNGGTFSNPTALGLSTLAKLTVTDTATFGQTLTLSDITAPVITTNQLYNVGGDLYWAGNILSGTSTDGWASSGEFSILNGGENSMSFILRPSLNAIDDPQADMIISVSSNQANTITGTNFLREIIGGYDNTIGAQAASSILSSRHSEISGGSHAQILGGSYLTYEGGDYSSVIGGSANTLQAGDYAVLLGGRAVVSSGSYNTIIGSESSTSTTGRTVILGARNSSITGGSFVFMGPVDDGSTINIGSSHAAIVTGSGQFVSGNYGFIGSGIGNTVSGQYGVVLNGQNNTASKQYSTVLNGNNGVASGTGATVLGGGSNIASGDYSVGGGLGAFARSYGEAVFGIYPSDYTPNSVGSLDANDRLFVVGNGTAFNDRRNALTLLKNANMGLGTDVPEQMLHLSGVEKYLRIEHSDTSYPNAATEKLGGIEWFGNDPSGTGPGVYARIVGISDETDDTAGGITFETASNPGGIGPTEKVRINSAGNVGIGTTTPQTKLQVTGIIAPSLDNTYTLGNATYRFSEVYAANGVINTSDIRLKHDPQTLTYGLDTILALEPISYTWVDQPDQGIHFGLSAQHVRDLIPEIVAEGTDSNKTLGIRYTELIPILISAIQELVDKVATLAEGTFDTIFATTIVVENDIEADDVTAREDVRAGRDLRADGRLCLEDLCITRDDLAAILGSQTGQEGAASPIPAVPNSEPTPEEGATTLDEEATEPDDTVSSDEAELEEEDEPAEPSSSDVESAEEQPVTVPEAEPTEG